MAASLHKYTVAEAQNAALGQAGAIFEDGTTAITGKNIVAITMLTDVTFTTLLPASSEFIGTAGGNGDAIDTSNTFPKGVTIYGHWTGFTLNGGTVIAYVG